MTVKWQDYIEERRDVVLGKPVFKGTCLTVEQVLRELGTGITHEELLRTTHGSKPNIFRPPFNMRRTLSPWRSRSTSSQDWPC